MTARRAFIIGNGGHAHVIRSLLPGRPVTFLVERDPGPDEALQEAFLADPDRETDLYVAIGDTRVRRRYFDRLKGLGLTVASCIAPNAWVAEDASLGEGLFLGAGAIVGTRSRIGDNVIVNTLSSIDHDCVVGDDVQITAGVILGAHLEIGARCYFGMRSCVLPRVEIGADSVVMAGALVVRSAPAGVMLGGSPARVIGPAAGSGAAGLTAAAALFSPPISRASRARRAFSTPRAARPKTGTEERQRREQAGSARRAAETRREPRPAAGGRAKRAPAQSS
jgi:sugar O-acyltransferase (sialic acid O-acetyltransferase NeuD family)